MKRRCAECKLIHGQRRCPRCDCEKVLTEVDWWLYGLLSGLASLLLAAVVVPNFTRAPSRGMLTACKSNLKNMGTALEMYSTDWSGRYPPDIRLLTPNYLKTVPTCPGAGSDTYTSTYRWHAEPDAYTIFCRGENHHSASIRTANYPQYTAVQGLIERP
ncbi:MAG: hypothetical protein AB7S38_17945 [Vulcanimicrobiota bacterium]